MLFVVVFWRLGVPSFWDPDEAHYAETTSELIATGDWWAPYYNEEPFFDKPIFFHQLQAAAMRVFGENELGARMVPALAAVALVLFTGWFGAQLISAQAGFVAALLLAANPGVFGLARYAILETLFMAFLFAGVGLVAVAAMRNRPALQWPGYILIAFAVMVKGPLALVLSGLAMVFSMAMSTDVRRRLLSLHWIIGFGAAVAISSPWFIYMYQRFGGTFVDAYLLDENLRLYATDRFKGQPGYSFYFRILATGMLPWTGILIGRLFDVVRAAVKGRKCDGAEVLLWAWTIAVIGFFTFSRFKLDHYVFAAAPSLCLLCARAWVDLHEHPDLPEHRGARVGLWLVGPFLLLLGTAAAYLLVAQLNLPAAIYIVPATVIVAGLLMLVRADADRGRPARVPWLAVTAMTTIYAGIVMFVIPALDGQKVIPDVAKWVSGQAGPDTRVASYELSRWNTAFRFYVDRHVTMLDDPQEMAAFFNDPEPFYVVMLQPEYEEFRSRGLPVKEVYSRAGMWVTSGRALWRRAPPPTMFVVVAPHEITGLQMRRKKHPHP
ncbi:MAG: phospholipid carrier-dependent glycosyltransferase [Vicinamibacterales bacterium]